MLPSEGQTNFRDMAGSYPLPNDLACRCQDAATARRHFHTDVIRLKSDKFNTRDDIAALARLLQLERKDPGVLELPGQLIPVMRATACNLANKLPKSSLSDGEMSLFFTGLQEEPSKDFVPAKRKSLSEIVLLLAQVVGDKQYLDLGCIWDAANKSAYDLLRNGLCEMTQLTNKSASEIPQARLLLAAEGRLLSRAYAEGLRVTLSRHILTLFDSARDRPHISEPWVFIRRDPRGVPLEIRCVWARLGRLPY